MCDSVISVMASLHSALLRMEGVCAQKPSSPTEDTTGPSLNNPAFSTLLQCSSDDPHLTSQRTALEKEQLYQIEAGGNQAEDWLVYILWLSSLGGLSDDIRYCVLMKNYSKAFKCISEESMKREAYACLLVKYAHLVATVDEDEGRRVITFARSSARRFAVAHIAAAQYEISKGNSQKVDNILYKAKNRGAQPKELIDKAFRNMVSGKQDLLPPDFMRDWLQGTFLADKENRMIKLACKSQDVFSQPVPCVNMTPSWHKLDVPHHEKRSASSGSEESTADNSLNRPFTRLARPGNNFQHIEPLTSIQSNYQTPRITVSPPVINDIVTEQRKLRSFHSTPDCKTPGVLSRVTVRTKRFVGKPQRVLKGTGASNPLLDEDMEESGPLNDHTHELLSTKPSSLPEVMEVDYQMEDIFTDPDTSPGTNQTQHKLAPDLKISPGTNQTRDKRDPDLEISPTMNQTQDKRTIDMSSATLVQTRPISGSRTQHEANHASGNVVAGQTKLNSGQPSEALDLFPRLVPLTSATQARENTMETKSVKIEKSLKSQILETQSEVPVAQSQIPAAQSQIPAAQSQVPAAQSQIPAAQSQIPSAQSQIPASQCQIPAVEPQIPTHQSQIPAAKPQISAVQSHVPCVQPQISDSQLIVANNSTRSMTLTLPSTVPAAATVPPDASANSSAPPKTSQNTLVPNNAAVQPKTVQTSHASTQTSQPSAPSTAEQSQSRVITVNGKSYQALSVIGRGGFSKVYNAWSLDNMCQLAIKCVTLEADDNTTMQSYMNEIHLLQKTQYSPYVIRMYDYEYCAAQGTLYVVMERGDTDLSTHFRSLHKTGRMNLAIIIHYWIEMLKAVLVLHKEGIVHSDLKPANFLLVAGNLKLIDFGIANTIQKDHTSVTLEHQLGTLNYMSPEAITGDNTCLDENGQPKPKIKINVKSDVWSLGCILYTMVYGKTPFQHLTNQLVKLQAIINPQHEISFPELRDPELLSTLKKCLQRNPKLRPSIEELLQEPVCRNYELK